MKRLFIAIDFSEGEKEAVEGLKNKCFKEYPGVRWIPRGNLHFTLKFIGFVKGEKIKKIEEALLKISREFKKFTLRVRRFRTFNREPFIVFLEIEKSKKLEQLAGKIEEETRRLGFPEENRSFNPHITLGRGKKLLPSEKKTLNEQAEKLIFKTPFNFEVKEITLMESNLKATGAVYVPHSRFTFLNKK